MKPARKRKPNQPIGNKCGDMAMSYMFQSEQPPHRTKNNLKRLKDKEYKRMEETSGQ